jgi:hypothetical protein
MEEMFLLSFDGGPVPSGIPGKSGAGTRLIAFVTSIRDLEELSRLAL